MMDCDGDNSERRRFGASRWWPQRCSCYSGAQSLREEIMEWWLESSSTAADGHHLTEGVATL
ncbi:unnamed protein product [Brassica rapa subsp. narinosa]